MSMTGYFDRGKKTERERLLEEMDQVWLNCGMAREPAKLPSSVPNEASAGASPGPAHVVIRRPQYRVRGNEAWFLISRRPHRQFVLDGWLRLKRS